MPSDILPLEKAWLHVMHHALAGKDTAASSQLMAMTTSAASTT
jgi:hypothetical protein